MAYHVFHYNEDFSLESGRVIPGFHLGYTTLGTLNKQSDNVVWVFHAFTAGSNPAFWWPKMIGKGKLFDPEVSFIICVNVPGSCYGSLSPMDIDPECGEPYYHHFPVFSIKDVVRTYRILRDHLGIRKAAWGIGGSMGGQQLLEWAVSEPYFFERIIPIATSAKQSPWAIAFNSTQRWCIENDSTWKRSVAGAGREGLKVARSMALISYRNYGIYSASQSGYAEGYESQPIDQKIYKAETYQHYQGEKLALRFNAFSYYFLTRTMDTHDVGRGRGGLSAALGRITSNVLWISIKNDMLFPESQQLETAALIKNATVGILQSDYGHDGFLIDQAKIERLIRDTFFLGKQVSPQTLVPVFC